MCIYLMVCSSYAISGIIICFYISFFLFLAWDSWVAICFKMVSAILPLFIVPLVSCFILNHFATFLLVGLKTLIFINWSLSVSSLLYIFCIIFKKSFGFFCGCFSSIVMSYALYISFALLLYSWILHLLSTFMRFKMTFKFFRNNKQLDSTLCYIIKNWKKLLVFNLGRMCKTS